MTTWVRARRCPTLRVRVDVGHCARTCGDAAVARARTLDRGRPVASDGTVRLALDRGSAEVRVDVVGWAPPLSPAVAGAAAPISTTGRTRLVSPTTVVDGSRPRSSRARPARSTSPASPACPRPTCAASRSPSSRPGCLARPGQRLQPVASYVVGQVKVSTSLRVGAHDRADHRWTARAEERLPVAGGRVGEAAGLVRLGVHTGGARTRMLRGRPRSWTPPRTSA